MADEEAPNWNDRLMHFAEGAAKSYVSNRSRGETFGGLADYDVQHRYRFGAGGPQVGGTAPLSEELGYIAHKKIFQSGTDMSKPSISKSSYYDQSLDYRKMNMAGLKLRAMLERYGTQQAGGGGDTPPPSEDGGAEEVQTPPYIFTKPRSSGNLGEREGAID